MDIKWIWTESQAELQDNFILLLLSIITMISPIIISTILGIKINTFPLSVFICIIQLVGNFLYLAFYVGYTKMTLKMLRGHNVSIGDIFSCLNFLDRAIAISVIVSVKVFLWSMLFFIPGIISAIANSMCYFIMVDNPDFTFSECISESKRLMNGKKLDYFLLMLSIVPVYIFICIILSTVFYLCIKLTSSITVLSIILAVIWIITFLLMLFYGYTHTRLASAIFYNEMVENDKEAQKRMRKQDPVSYLMIN